MESDSLQVTKVAITYAIKRLCRMGGIASIATLANAMSRSKYRNVTQILEAIEEEGLGEFTTEYDEHDRPVRYFRLF